MQQNDCVDGIALLENASLANLILPLPVMFRPRGALMALSIDTKEVAVCNTDDDFVFDQQLFDDEARLVLNSILSIPSLEKSDAEGPSKSVSIKFMVTMQDEADLQMLGYSKEQIDKLKPQEVADILQEGLKCSN